MTYYQRPAEVWDEKKCRRMARHLAKDGLGTPYPFKGYIGDSQYGHTRYNGGITRNGEWYEGEFVPLPIIPPNFHIVRIRTWGYRIIEGPFVDTKTILHQFAAQQGWNDDTLLRLLTDFVQTRQSHWPKDTPMLTDLESFLQNIANEENSWSKEESEESGTP